MTDEPQDDPGKKMRKLLSSASPMARLPKKDSNSASFLPRQADEGADMSPTQETSASEPALASIPKPSAASAPKRGFSLFGPALWNIASIISLSVNALLVLVLALLVLGLNRYGLSVSTMLNMGTQLLGGLYGNFEKMDRAHITTNIQVNTTIPVQFDLPINQQTNVVLSQDVTISNALITVNTGALNITQATTTIVLPQGTTLPVVLNLTVPVNTTVPVTLNVPVDIPLEQTQLHEPFTGLQEVVRPFYCMIDSNAVNLDGEQICK